MWKYFSFFDLIGTVAIHIIIIIGCNKEKRRKKAKAVPEKLCK